ncbi:MAG: glutamine--tRNA ligase/YqeY domain fusion protein [Myxococcota bacterium]|nr:glutamine--tRNA ligase/YqeY domain fusion protein [Myxococcota bacterium]
MDKKQSAEPSSTPTGSNFIQTIIEDDLRSNKHDGQISTRFPPEPNGYLHIGHAKSICLNFGLAKRYGGKCHLRFDDTNPAKEEVEYVNSIQEDVQWLGFDWGENLFHASDYFEKFYEYALHLIKEGNAYVCSLNDEEIRAYRGTVNEAGKHSPYRERRVEENLNLLERMRAGEFSDGAHTLRAKIDMAAANMKMRDPLLYRIRHTPHDRTGDKWCIYPMYDFAHCLSDAQEGITHSICTLEFENNRELYDWLIDHVPLPYHKPHQYEFARLNLTYTVMSKRKLLQLVEGGAVSGWDDPRMPTLAGLRRRGYTPEAIQDFTERIGVAKANSVVDVGLLEYSLRDDLNRRAARVMAVLKPLKVIIENYPEDKVEELQAPAFPQNEARNETRKIPFSRVVYIEADDFSEVPPKGFHRLSPGQEVRLRYGYVIRCDEVIKDANGKIEALRCSYDPETLGRNPEGRKIKAAIHWVSAQHALKVEVRLYDRLFKDEDPDSAAADSSLEEIINPDSSEVLQGVPVEPSIAAESMHPYFQFERLGYFFVDPVDSQDDALVVNRTVSLKDSWVKTTEAVKEQPARKQKSVEKQDKQSATDQKVAKKEARERILGENAELRSHYQRYTNELNLNEDDAGALATNPALNTLFNAALEHFTKAQPLANWMINELAGELKERSVKDLSFGGQEIAKLVELIDRQTISSKIAKTVFAHMLEHGGDPEDIVKEKGLEQISDPQVLLPIITNILSQHPDEAAEYAAGQTKRLGFFVGKVMGQTQGKANPQLVNTLLRDALSNLPK